MKMPSLCAVRAADILKFLALIALVSTISPAVGRCDVVNGNFSAGTSGWVFINDVGVYNSTDYVNCCGSGDTGTGTFASFGAGDQPDNGQISQSFATVAGQQYLLTFQYGAFSSPADIGTQSVEIAVGNLDTDLTSAPSARELADVFSNYQYEFEATGNVSTLIFTDTSTNTYSIDGFLDTIAVTPVSTTPEPSSLLLFGTGVLGLSVFCRSRLQRQSHS